MLLMVLVQLSFLDVERLDLILQAFLKCFVLLRLAL